ncbi:MAG: hypothetical protein OEZ43_05820 [Gammaproteobacteria bacterium]|nr:hypothetical protein [Gammaproteobacteria bacterium]
MSVSRSLWRFAISGLTLLYSFNTHALLIGADDNIASNLYVKNWSYTGSFDINSMTGLDLSSGNYLINSASISFSFIDDQQDLYFSYYTRTSYDGSTYTGTNEYFDMYFLDPQETVSITLGDTSQTLVGDYYSTPSIFSHQYTNSRTVPSGYYVESSCGWQDSVYGCTEWVDTSYTVYDYDYFYKRNQGYAIDQYVVMDLDSIAIEDLMSDGLLSYKLVITGDMIFQNAYLNIDYSPAYTMSSNMASVPEINTVALFGLGLLGLAGFIGRRKSDDIDNHFAY